MKKLGIIFLLITFTGCSPSIHRGQFSLLSTKLIVDEFEILSESQVNGKACFNQLKMAFMQADGVFDAAVIDALNKIQNATILLDSEFIDTGSCIIVSGMPARVINN